MKKSRTGRHLLWSAIFIIYILMVTLLCFKRFSGNLDMPSAFMGIPTDKVVHFLMFLPFSIVGTLAFRRDNYWRTLVWITISGAVVATSFELMQSVLTTYRTTDPWDLVANLLAMAAGCTIMAFAGLFIKTKK